MRPQAYWKCIRCGATYQEKIQASACCTDADRVFVCSECEQDYPSRIDATECCSDKPAAELLYYCIGRPPNRSRVLVRLADRGRDRVLIAAQDSEIVDVESFWRNPLIRQGDVVDILGACSICGNEDDDPRQEDGGPTLVIFKPSTEQK